VSNPPVQVEPQIFYGNMNNIASQAGLVFPSSSSAIQLNDKLATLYNFSLGVQRDLGHGSMLDVKYVGNFARHLLQSVDVNEVPYGAHFLLQNQDPVAGGALPDNFFRPYPGYGSISTNVDAGTANYSALQ